MLALALALVGAASGGPTVRAVPPAEAAPARDLEAVSAFDRLPLLRRGEWFGSTSSRDVTGGNDDGFSGAFSELYVEDGRHVLLDVAGPGCVYLLRTILFAGDVRIEVGRGSSRTVDELSFEDLYSGDRPPFLAPLVRWEREAHASSWSFVPIPFADGIRISSGERGRFFDIFYRRYAEGTAVEPYRPDQNMGDAIARWRDVGAPFDPRPAERESRTVTLAPRSITPVFARAEAGTITALRLRVPALSATLLRRVRLRAFWDGSAVAAVDSPLGPFFGTGYWPVSAAPEGEPRFGHTSETLGDVPLARLPTRSLPVGVSERELYSFFPMPFDRSARLELVNESDQAVGGISLEVDVAPGVPPAPSGRFHAAWRQENPTRDHVDYTVVETEGHGHFVGAVLVMSSVELDPEARDRVQRLYLEGDGRFYIDGNRTPINAGTGTEEVFNWGGYDIARIEEVVIDAPFSYEVSGYPVHDVDVQDHTVMYRFYLGDLVPYYRSFRFTLEHGPGPPAGDERSVPSNHSGTAFFYQRDQAVLELSDAIAPGDGTSREEHAYEAHALAWEGSRALPFEGERQVLFTRAYRRDLETGGHSSEAEAQRFFGQRATGSVRFEVRARSDNVGVKLRRLLDYAPAGRAGQESAERPQPLVAPAERARVFVDGEEVGEWYLHPRHARLAWLEDELEIPARFTRGKRRLHVRLEVPSGGVWSSFGYRVYSYLP